MNTVYNEWREFTKQLMVGNPANYQKQTNNSLIIVRSTSTEVGRIFERRRDVWPSATMTPRNHVVEAVRAFPRNIGAIPMSSITLILATHARLTNESVTGRLLSRQA